MKRLILLHALAFCMLHVGAQVNLSGHVQNNEGESLPGANVVLVETSVGTSTDVDGNFKLRSVKQGKYQLKVSFVGYQDFVQDLTLAADTKLDVVLASSSIITDEIIVRGNRAGSKTPIAHTDIKASDFKDRNLGSDITYLMQLSPSVVTSSDAGAGVGYTSIRVRGTDLNRINVMVNGIPLNDAESHGVYWVNMPDFASTVDNIQIQRGVGTSANGAGAFGASFNFQTQGFNDKPYAEINSAAGSFNTFKNTVMLGTGLINKHFTFDARLSAISSDGYIDRASSDLKSYFVSGAYHDENTIVRLVTFVGKEKTYQAWYGIPKARLNNDTVGMLNYLYNSDLNLYNVKDKENLFNSDRKYNPYLYPNQTDNYTQQHYQLHLAHQFNQELSFNAALHYTHGEGYYEELKNYASLSKYNIPDVAVGNNAMNIPDDYIDGGMIVKTDLVRQKWLNNDFYGVVGSFNYTLEKVKTTVGGGYNEYDGHHYGYVTWSRFVSPSTNKYEYYRATGKKTDFNIFIRSEYSPIEPLTLFADVQYRGIQHDINGLSDKRKDVTQSHSFDFYNPKFGLSYQIEEGVQAYASWARSHREPNRNNYVDADSGKWPTSERLDDIEAGVRVSRSWFSAEINGFNMQYNNQLVLTGEINESGDAIMTNVKDSYRQGVELSAAVKPLDWLELSGTVTYSQNKIKDFTEYVDNWNYWNDPQNEPLQLVTKLGKTDLSFSPNLVWNSRVKFLIINNLTLEAIVRHVGDQYIDNTSNSARKLDSYTVGDCVVSYKILPNFMKELSINFMVNNVFDKDYISNAWVYRFSQVDPDTQKRYESTLDGYFPQAFRNYMIGLSLKF